MQSFVIFLLMLFFTRLKVPRSRMVTICVYPFISRPEHSTKAHRILEWMTNEGGNELIIHKKKEGSQGDTVCPLLPKWYEYKKHKVALESWIQLSVFQVFTTSFQCSFEKFLFCNFEILLWCKECGSNN